MDFMDKTYTFKEANELIRKYNQILGQLISSKDYEDKYSKRMYNDASFLLKSSFFQDKISKDFKAGMASESDYKEIGTLTKDIFFYLRSRALFLKCENIYNNYNDEIQKNIAQLKKGQNIIKWVFSSSNNKENAAAAYTFLNNMLNANSDFYIQSNEVITSLANIERINIDDIYAEVRANIDEFKGVLFKLHPDIINVGYMIGAIENIKKEYGTLSEIKNRISGDIENEKIEIKRKLEMLASSEVMRVLREIPVEELNRNKNGVRAKSLKDSNCYTIADVYTKSIAQLEAIQGISLEGAKIIHNIACDIANEASKNVKIKLNADSKDEASTNVVKALNRYIRKNNYILEYNKLLDEYQERIDESLKEIIEIMNGIKYFFSSVQEKEKYIDSYKFVQDAVYGKNFGDRVKQINKNYFTIRECSSDEAWRDFASNSIQYYNAIEEIYPGLLGNEDVFYGLPESLAKQIQEESLFPNGLTCTLRHYQEMGVKYILHQGRALLGDEMGLGKTVQAIATMVSLKNTGASHFIVVCPASVVTNWCREISKHSKLVPIMIHGRNKLEAINLWKQDGGVAVTTYETTQHINLNDDFKYSLLVVDEAHYIKNPEAQRSINTEKLAQNAERILFMTGTALENKVDEMINLIRILNQPIADKIKKIAYLSSAPKFRELVAPVYYRRKREDVLTELPELIETKEWCDMSDEEEKIYEDSLYSGTFPEIRRLSWNVDDLSKSSKAQRLKELIDEAKDDERKVIVFSFFLSTIQKISEYLGDICTTPITGSVNPEKRQQIIDEFDKAPAGTVLLSQIMAGGTGLNIQSASVVIICEPQFKPSIENQAISRAYRMGQARNVLVYRLLCDDTVDEKITDLLEEKQKIFDEFADKSVAAEEAESVEVNEKAFGDIIKEEIERINEKKNTTI